MIATKVDMIYGVELPSDVRAFLDSLAVAITLGLQGIATTPLECLGLAGYVPRLVFWMVVPPALIGAVVGVNAAVMLRSMGRGLQPKGTLFEQSLPLVLKALFLAYPIITIVAFEAFPCHEFEADAYLKADVAIECRTAEHERAT